MTPPPTWTAADLAAARQNVIDALTSISQSSELNRMREIAAAAAAPDGYATVPHQLRGAFNALEAIAACDDPAVIDDIAAVHLRTLTTSRPAGRVDEPRSVRPVWSSAGG